MDTFDTSEEVMSEIDIEATEVDFGENFEHGVNDQEHENTNEQEAGIGGENGERSIEDEKPEEKEATLSEFITANRGGSEEFKLEYEGTFVLSTLNEEQKSAQADLLTTLTANPEQPIMLPDHIEGKTTYFTATRMDNEGNLKYEIRSFTNKEEEKEEKPIDKVEEAKLEEATLNLELNIDIDKQEEVGKETLLNQSLLTEIEVSNEQEIQNVQEVIQSEEAIFVAPEASQIDVEPITIQEEGVIDNVVSYEQSNIDPIPNSEQVVEIVAADKVEVGRENIINANDVPRNVEEKTVEKVLTLEDRIRELLRDEDEPVEIVAEQVQTFEVQNAQPEQIVIDINKTTEINTTTENVVEAEITSPSIHNTEISELVVNEIVATTTEKSAISNERVEQVVVNVEEVENRAEIHETVPASHIENIQQQRTEVEQTFTTEKTEVNVVEEKQEEIVLVVNEQESEISTTIEQVITQGVNTDIEVGKSEHATVEQVRIEETNIVNENDEDKNITLQEVEVSEPFVNEMIDVSKETSVNSNQEVGRVVNMNETTERNNTVETIKAEEKVVEKVQSSDVAVEAVANRSQELSKTETILSEVVIEAHVAETKDIKSESNVVQEVVVNNIQTQGIEKMETVPYVADSNRSETKNVGSINIENTKEEKIVVEAKGREINLKTEKIDNPRPEKITTERIIAERRVQDREEKPEKVILNNDKESKIVNTREDKVVAKETKSEKTQVPNIKTGREVKNNVLPFKSREIKVDVKNVEVKSTQPVVVEKVDTSKEVSRLPNANREKAVDKNQEEKTPKGTREAIVLSINRNTNNTTRNEATISLEKPKEETRITEETVKAKPLDGHEILLQILGLSQNGAEVRNAEPANSRSVPNTNQEEQETKSTKLIPSIYQQRNLNGITLKIAA